MFEDAPVLDESLHIARLRRLSALKVVDPYYGDMKLSVFPFEHDGSPITLPEGFRRWEENLRDLMALVPRQQGATTFFVTIDTKFFTQPEALRREGVHMDGNFCADPDFSPRTSWGPPSPSPTWGGILAIGREAKPDNSHVQIGFKIPYDLVIPVGKYVSGTLGGTLVASSQMGCHAWPGTYKGTVGNGGDWSEMIDQIGEPVEITENTAWFMSSNCPHATLVIPAGVRRTLIRITFPHNYDNRVLLP